MSRSTHEISKFKELNTYVLPDFVFAPSEPDFDSTFSSTILKALRIVNGQVGDRSVMNSAACTEIYVDMLCDVIWRRVVYLPFTSPVFFFQNEVL